MSAYGFEVISREEAQEFGLPEGSGLFSELFINMLDEISKNKFKAKDYDQAPNMTSIEKKISFLNRYFVYKKVRTVNTESIELELGEYNETEAIRDNVETKHAQSVAATEAVDEPKPVLEKEKVTKKAKETKEVKPKTSKKLLIIESDDEDE
jgi:hypothetical protein